MPPSSSYPPFASPGTEVSSFTSPTSDYANSLFSPPLTKSSQLSLNTTVLGASAVSHSKSVATPSGSQQQQHSQSNGGGGGGRKRMPASSSGGQAYKGVGVFSPTLEEDEEGVFSSAASSYPSSPGTNQQHPPPPTLAQQQQRSETPPLKFTPRRPSDGTVKPLSGSSTTTQTPTKSTSSSARPTPSRTQAMISQFEQRQQTPRSYQQPPTTPSRTPMTKSQLDKPLPPISPQDAPTGGAYPRPMTQHSPASATYLPAPTSPSSYTYTSPHSPTHRGGLDGHKRSPLRDGIKSLVKKFSASTSPAKFRRGHKASASSGSEMSISRPTHIGGVSWDLRVEEDGGGEEVLGSEVGPAGKSELWDYPRTSRMDGEGIDSDAEPYELSDPGAASPLATLGPPAQDLVHPPAAPVSPRAGRPLPAFPIGASPSQHHTGQLAQQQQARQSSSSFAPTLSSEHSQPLIIRHGPLLLFSAESSPPHWIRTTATLSPSLFSFAFASLRGSLEHVDYALPGDSVVRSVPEREASGRWPAPFGNDDEDDDVEVHYLEVALAGRGSIAIAVRNVGERLGWVGAIWDAILAGVMSPDPSGSQLLAAFPAAPVTSPRPPAAAVALLPPADNTQQRQQDSPQESILTTPPLSPARAAQQIAYDSAGILSSGIMTEGDDSGQSADDAHIRRSEDSDRSAGPPQLTLLPSKPLALDLLRRGSGQDDANSDHSLRFSVEQMFRRADFSSYTAPPSPPPIQQQQQGVKKPSNVAALASAYESNSIGSGGGGKGSWSKASSGVGRAERGEGPTSLDHFEDHTRAARIRSQAHHRHSKSNPPPASPPATHGQPAYYYSTRPGTSPSAVAMGRSRSDSLPQTQQTMFSPGGRSEYYAQDFDESDLNPSRSASQIQRRNPPPTAVGVASQQTLQEAQYEDVQTPRQSLLFETVDRPTSNPAPAEIKSLASTTAAASGPSPDLTAVIQLLSAQAASSSTRGELTDLRLASVQEDVGTLVLRSTTGDGKLDVMLDSLRGVEEGMKEVALGVVGANDERTTLQMTVDEVNGKLSAVLALCQRFGGASTSRSSRTLANVEGSPSAKDSAESGEGSATPRRMPPPVLPIIGLPGGVGGRLPDDAFDNGVAAQTRIIPNAEATEPSPDTSAATENASLIATGDGSSNASTNASSPTAAIDEVLQLVKSQQAARGAQDQQTSDIARYLNELNRWMEEFVRNGHSSVDALSDRVAHLQDLIQPPPAPTPRLGEAPPHSLPTGIIGEIASLRNLVTEVRDKQAQSNAAGAQQDAIQHRLDQLLGSVESERQRYQQQNSSIESVIGLLDRQRMENQQLLKAMVHDLKSEIQGERIRFIDAMRDATQINIEQHLQKFKDQLSHEVSRSLHDLHRMREEKKVLEGQIAELFAFKVKNGDVIKVPSAAQSAAAAAARRPSYPIAGPPPFPSPSVPLPPLPQQTYQQ